MTHYWTERNGRWAVELSYAGRDEDGNPGCVYSWDLDGEEILALAREYYEHTGAVEAVRAMCSNHLWRRIVEGVLRVLGHADLLKQRYPCETCGAQDRIDERGRDCPACGGTDDD